MNNFEKWFEEQMDQCFNEQLNPRDTVVETPRVETPRVEISFVDKADHDRIIIFNWDCCFTVVRVPKGESATDTASSKYGTFTYCDGKLSYKYDSDEEVDCLFEDVTDKKGIILEGCFG